MKVVVVALDHSDPSSSLQNLNLEEEKFLYCAKS
jgi:hypothetical protein